MWKEIKPKQVLIAYSQSPGLLNTKFKELNIQRDYNVYNKVEDIGQKLNRSQSDMYIKWFTEKSFFDSLHWGEWFLMKPLSKTWG